MGDSLTGRIELLKLMCCDEPDHTETLYLFASEVRDAPALVILPP